MDRINSAKEADTKEMWETKKIIKELDENMNREGALLQEKERDVVL